MPDRGEERTALLAASNDDDRGKIGGAMMRKENDGHESTFHYLSSIVVSALALTGAVIGVESVWQRCKSGNCNPGSFLLPGDHRYAFVSLCCCIVVVVFGVGAKKGKTTSRARAREPRRRPRIEEILNEN